VLEKNDNEESTDRRVMCITVCKQSATYGQNKETFSSHHATVKILSNTTVRDSFSKLLGVYNDTVSSKRNIIFLFFSFEYLKFHIFLPMSLNQ